ncbi:HpcH/HpaI aldolase family protein [Mongoliimonas terrestris]|uniref:HpcH/HpaI aldolase family protein n=1 Tax=Mongoliimonas terrestris TaxID=1709001 RepID=UPI0009499A1B|nr:aldolase/citrate lyase family protein [Mongoliimonas terrestris]
MTNPSLAGRFKTEDTILAGWISLPEPLVAEACVRAGFSALVVDLQHGQVDMLSATRIIAGIRHAGGRAMLRIPVGEYATASRLLDAGADAVIAPMIETVADAEAFASFVKYPPLGTRSWGPTRAVQLSGGTPEAYRTGANGETLAIAMIETLTALRNVEAILALPGIDGVFVGPADLSIALSNGAALDVDAPDAVAAFRTIADAARAAGKIAGIYAVDPAHARRCFGMGFRFATLMSDLGYLTAGAKAAIAAARS